jgi:nucleotide-binding universal stress UspA family protein
MSEVILVVLQRSDTATDLLLAAERFAELADGARLNVTPATDVASLALEACYKDWLAGPHATAVEARWNPIAGDATDAVEERGARADIIVVARPAEDDDPGIRPIFRRALLKTARPILVVPPGRLAQHDFGCRVAIAWRQDEHTAKAVLPALRYIAHAERVFLLAGMRKDGAPIVPEVLTEHEVRAELHVLSIGAGAFGQALLAKAHELTADMLVMGAYANGPLHKLVYGGVTRFMLQHADLPVLMRY